VEFLRVDLQQQTIAAVALALAGQTLAASKASPTPAWTDSLKQTVLDDLRGGQLTLDAMASSYAGQLASQILSTNLSATAIDIKAHTDRFQAAFTAGVISVVRCDFKAGEIAGVLNKRLHDEVRAVVLRDANTPSGEEEQQQQHLRFPLNCLAQDLKRASDLTKQLVMLNQAEHHPLYVQILGASHA